MCLGVPGRVLKILDADPLIRSAEISFDGVVQTVSLAFVPEVNAGDYVIVHAGFGLSKVNEEEAGRIFKTLAELDQLEL